MVILQYIFISSVFAVAWMVITGQINLWGFLIGFTLSFILTVLILRQRRIGFNPLRIHMQVFYFLWYVLILGVDIIKSGVDVALRVLGFRPVNPGIIQVAVQDEGEIVTAMTMHGITITPGQLVVEYHDHYVFVHCLDIDDSLPGLEGEQTSRIKHLKRIVGR